jgi:hypothetical protein
MTNYDSSITTLTNIFIRKYYPFMINRRTNRIFDKYENFYLSSERQIIDAVDRGYCYQQLLEIFEKGKPTKKGYHVFQLIELFGNTTSNPIDNLLDNAVEYTHIVLYDQSGILHKTFTMKDLIVYAKEIFIKQGYSGFYLKDALKKYTLDELLYAIDIVKETPELRGMNNPLLKKELLELSRDQRRRRLEERKKLYAQSLVFDKQEVSIEGAKTISW